MRENEDKYLKIYPRERDSCVLGTRRRVEIRGQVGDFSNNSRMSKVVLGAKLAISVANRPVPKYRLSRSRNTGTFLILQSAAEKEGSRSRTGTRSYS